MNRLKRIRKVKKRKNDENAMPKPMKLKTGDVESDNMSYSCFEPEIKIESGVTNPENGSNSSQSQQYMANQLPTVRCTLCGEMVPASNFEKHKFVEELYLSAMKCQICKISFKKKSAFRIHIYDQHKIHHCKLCPEVFSKRQHYRMHKELVHDLKKKPRVPCDLCNRTFASKQILKRHRNEVHFGQREPETKCPQCDYKSYNRSNMKVHIDKHNNTPAFVCDLCGKGCFTKTSLNDHTANAHGHGFKCDICGKFYKNESSLKSHSKIHVPGFDPATLKQQCEECGEIFNHKSSLNKHLLKHRGLDKTFDCDVCGKKLSSKGSYRSHMAIHSGYKPYACEYCDKRFGDKQYLTQHRRVHTGEKPFKCDECGQCFSQRSSLNRHKRYHMGLRR